MLKRIFYNIDDTIAGLAVSGVIIFTIVNVILRYVFNSPVAAATEIVLALFVWFVFIGVSSAMKRDSHVGMDFFIINLPKKVRLFFECLRAIAIYFTLIYIFIYLGIVFTISASSKVTPILKISYRFIDMAIPVGGFFAAIFFTINFIKLIKRLCSDN